VIEGQKVFSTSQKLVTCQQFPNQHKVKLDCLTGSSSVCEAMGFAASAEMWMVHIETVFLVMLSKKTCSALQLNEEGQFSNA